jgi:hypothetical protein
MHEVKPAKEDEGFCERCGKDQHQPRILIWYNDASYNQEIPIEFLLNSSAVWDHDSNNGSESSTTKQAPYTSSTSASSMGIITLGPDNRQETHWPMELAWGLLKDISASITRETAVLLAQIVSGVTRALTAFLATPHRLWSLATRDREVDIEQGISNTGAEEAGL